MSNRKSIAAQILEWIQARSLMPGAHLPAQLIADELQISRSPINKALAQLYEKGLLRREKNRGYFLSANLDAANFELQEQLALNSPDPVTDCYFKLAEDLRLGAFPVTFTEALLKGRYQLTATQMQTLLARISREGWVSKKQGYGWQFSSMLNTPDALLQSYSLRLALEPAALLEPGYHLEPQVIEQCRAAEHHLLDGGIASDTADQLHERGVNFHEAIVTASANPFFIDTIRRVNRVRRVMSYRSMQDRERYRDHCLQHLQILSLLESGDNLAASEALRKHLQHTLQSMQKILNLF
jgi:DNA-binding GntR family transcriptional regulator